MPELILRTLGELLAFTVCALALGSLLVHGVERVVGARPSDEPSLREASVRLLLGLGGTGYVALVLALAHALRWWTLALLGVAMVAAARRDLQRFAGALRPPAGDRLALAGVALASCMAAGQFLAALAPVEASDELAYHLPIARAIESSQAVHQLLQTHDPYSNLPSLAECLYAAALSVDGPALAHALHLAILLAFVALAAAFVRELLGPRAGALAAVALLAYPHLTYNATTGYVDAASTAFELAAVLLVLRWLRRNEPRDLGAAAACLGLALSVKYTAGFTASVLAVAVAVTARRRGAWRPAAKALALLVATCGFWYLKNLVRFANPVWPFYFGHRHMDARTYADFVNGVHAFGPRTLHAFVETPWRFASDSFAVPFVAISLVVFALLSRAARPLALYAVLYVTYWFWLATHQVRFLLTGIAAATLAVVVALVAGGRTLRIGLAVVAVASVAIAQTHLHSFSVSAAADAVGVQFGSPKARYPLGLISRSSYLRRYFGCEADAVAYLDAHTSLSPVLMRQTALEPTFALHIRFGKLPLDTGTPRIALAALHAGDFRSVLVRQSEPGNLASTVAASAAVEQRLRPVWREGDCTILRVLRR